MKKFLIKNETDAALALLEKFNFSKQEAEKVLNNANETHQRSLAHLKNDAQDTFLEQFLKTPLDNVFNFEDSVDLSSYYNGSQDPNLPKSWVNAIQNECDRHNINMKKLHLITTHPDIPVYAQSKIKTVALNMVEATKNPQRLSTVAVHEMTHIAQGHALKEYIIRFAIVQKMPNSLQSKNVTIKNSVEHCNYINAIEKTADTLVACTDFVYTISYNRNHGGYQKNYADMKMLEKNWMLNWATTRSKQQNID